MTEIGRLRADAAVLVCPECNGDGWVEGGDRSDGDITVAIAITCPLCGGARCVTDRVSDLVEELEEIRGRGDQFLCSTCNHNLCSILERPCGCVERVCASCRPCSNPECRS